LITEDILPGNALLQKYAKAGVYTDCFSTEVDTNSLAEYVEERNEHQLLMRDFRGHTRSWLMVTPGRLYFGSAVLPIERPTYKWLGGLHRLYSRALLSATRPRLQ
jgi:hypothetical protein